MIVSWPNITQWLSGHTDDLIMIMIWNTYILSIDRRKWVSCHYQSLQWHHNGRDSVSNHQPHDCLLNRLFRRRSKKTSKLRVTGLCVGNSPGTGKFPAQKASNAKNVSIWWRHHDNEAIRLYSLVYERYSWKLKLRIFKIILWIDILSISCGKWKEPQGNAKRSHWWLINIGSGNGLVPSSSKPLS